MSGKSPRGTSAALPSQAASVTLAQVTTTWCVPGLRDCSQHLVCAGTWCVLAGLTGSLFLVSHLNVPFSLFTTVSADNAHGQLRGRGNTRWSYLLMADHRPSGNQRLTGGQRMKRPHCYLRSCPVLSPKPNCQASGLCDPRGGEAFAPGAPGSLRIFKGPVWQPGTCCSKRKGSPRFMFLSEFRDFFFPLVRSAMCFQKQ